MTTVVVWTVLVTVVTDILRVLVVEPEPEPGAGELPLRMIVGVKRRRFPPADLPEVVCVFE